MGGSLQVSCRCKTSGTTDAAAAAAAHTITDATLPAARIASCPTTPPTATAAAPTTAAPPTTTIFPTSAAAATAAAYTGRSCGRKDRPTLECRVGDIYRITCRTQCKPTQRSYVVKHKSAAAGYIACISTVRTSRSIACSQRAGRSCTLHSHSTPIQRLCASVSVSFLVSFFYFSGVETTRADAVIYYAPVCLSIPALAFLPTFHRSMPAYTRHRPFSASIFR